MDNPSSTSFDLSIDTPTVMMKFPVHASLTIGELKSQIFLETGIPLWRQMLKYREYEHYEKC